MSWHPQEKDLALYAGGDLSGWVRWRTALHVQRCDGCRILADAYREDLELRTEQAGDLPAGVNWERLSAEMTANIHLGLAAGECVAPARKAGSADSSTANLWTGWNWRPAAALAGLSMVFTLAWWLNLPASDTQIVHNAFSRWAHGQAGIPVDRIPVDQGPVVAASTDGIVEFRENGGGLGVSSGNNNPVAVSVGFDGSASAQYLDESTGQVAVATVYVQ